MNNLQGFRKLSNLNLWVQTHTDHEFVYSDGSDVEVYLEKVISEANDLRTLSMTLRSHIRDWATQYHLSPERSNLLRPLKISPNSSILELGCGCGAITRYLGETYSRVLAVEGSTQRAKLAALRCRDLDNVNIINTNFSSMRLNEKFDIVTLIGVLEYSGLYIEHQNPFYQALDIAKSFLSSDGFLIIAIENKLGLKYFSGCTEDHTNIHFDGIEGYASGSKIRTFGRLELINLLQSIGFQKTDFLYPFPDYKIPQSVLNLDVVERINGIECESSVILNPWISQFTDRNNRKRNLFSEKLVFKQLELNGLASHLSNSFLIVASFQKASHQIIPLETFAWKYNTMRHDSYATVVTLNKSKDSTSLYVQRELLSDPVKPKAPVEGSATSQIPIVLHNKVGKEYVENYIPGIPLDIELLAVLRQVEVLNLPSSSNLIYELVFDWFSYLTHNALLDNNIVDGQFFDCTLSNLVRGSDGIVHFVDREWYFTEALTIPYILWRGLRNFYLDNQFSVNSALPQFGCLNFIQYCFQLIGIDCSMWLDEDSIKHYCNCEAKVQLEISRLSNHEDFNEVILNGLYSKNNIPRLETLLTLMEKELHRQDKEMSDLKSQVNILKSYRFKRLNLVAFPCLGNHNEDVSTILAYSLGNIVYNYRHDDSFECCFFIALDESIDQEIEVDLLDKTTGILLGFISESQELSSLHHIDHIDLYTVKGFSKSEWHYFIQNIDFFVPIVGNSVEPLNNLSLINFSKADSLPVYSMT